MSCSGPLGALPACSDTAGFAAVPLQDPDAAVAELQRAVSELGLRGALVNGYSDAADGTARYYDAPEYREFWHALAELDVPLYLHPRNPHPASQGFFAGRRELLGPVWAFAVETGTHALRLITSGLFDDVSGAQVILGHLGEFLPFAMARAGQRLSHVRGVELTKPPRQAFHEHFWITTSGNCHSPSLIGALLEIGADRLMFAADYPFEAMEDGAAWFDGAPLSPGDRHKIGRSNALALLGLEDRPAVALRER